MFSVCWICFCVVILVGCVVAVVVGFDVYGG